MLFMKTKSKKRNIHKKNDILAKIFSVVAAVVLWFYVVDVQNTVEEKNIYNVPIVIENFKSIDGYSIVSGMDNAVDVVVKGTKSDISSLDADDIYASVDMADNYQAGDYKCSVRISAPEGVSVISRSVTLITVSVDKTISRTLEIRPVLTSYTISSDYIMGTPILDSDFVVVKGPEEIISKLSYAEVRLSSLGELKGDKLSRGEVVLIDENGNTIRSPYLMLNDSYNELYLNVTIPVKKVVTTIKENVEPNKPIDVNLNHDSESVGEVATEEKVENDAK